MDPLPPPPPGPYSWRQYMMELAQAILARTPLRSAEGEIDETPTGFRFLPRAAAAAATGRTLRLFQISDASTRSGGHITAARVRLVSSLLCQAEPTSGLTALAVADGSKIYAHVSFNTTTGAVTARVIEAASSVPADADGEVYLQIGSVAISGDTLPPTNLIYGPITGCRDWFTQPLHYNLEGAPAA